MSQKPVSIKAARKKKRAKTIIVYTKPEGEDWKPDTWKQLWRTLFNEALPFMLEYIRNEQQAAA